MGMTTREPGDRPAARHGCCGGQWCSGMILSRLLPYRPRNPVTRMRESMQHSEEGIMLTLLRGRNAAVFTALALLMAATRFHHSGSVLQFPDASLAVFFIGGALLPLAGFVALLVEAVSIDGLVMVLSNDVSGPLGLGICFTPSYMALPFAYGALWLAGRWAGRMNHITTRNLVVALLAWWVATSAAFLISDGSFYLYSGYFSAPNGAEYLARVQLYYLSYVMCSVPYLLATGALAVAWKIHHAVVMNSTGSQNL